VTRTPAALLVLQLLLMGACRPDAGAPVAPDDSTRPQVPAPNKPAPPAEVMANLEQRLLHAARVHVVFEVESHGGVETDLRGMLAIAPDGRAVLEAQGTFAGKPGVARIECDGKTLRGTSGTAKLEMPCPAAMQPALMLGLTRMGVLHNLARVWVAKPPDRAELAAGDDDPAAAMNAWVTTGAHRRPPSSDAPASGDVIAFDIAVDGQAVGDATLELGDDGLPRQRQQTVRFPGGEMKVAERYETFEVGEPESGQPPAATPASIVGTWSSPSCGERKYIREIAFANDGTFRSDDLVSPCPKGVTCVWSGIVTRAGTYSATADRVTLQTPAEKSPQARALPASLEIAGASLVEVAGTERCAYARR
jgi:hypothetical protein